MSLQENLLKLNYLYHLEMFGESFCEDFPPTRAPKSQGILGHSPSGAKIGFITQTPLLDENYHFLARKSALMLEDIITKVFYLQPKECCILSLFKTQETSYTEDLRQHLEILRSQITQSPAQTFVIFGDCEIANHLFQKNLQIGSVVKNKNKNFIITHSFRALIKLKTLKRQTLDHLKIAKGTL